MYTIFAENFSRLQEQIAELNKKAKKLKTDPITLQIVSQFTQEMEIANGLTQDVLMYKIEVDGPRPKLNGWQFSATLEHLFIEGEYMNVVRIVPGVQNIDEKKIEDYRLCPPDCEHCNVKRYRKDTYIVVHENGKVKQVGKSCLKDFLGHHSPEYYASIAEYMGNADSLCRAYEDEEGNKKERTITLYDYLLYVSASMRENGWISKTRAQEEYNKLATCYHALYNMQDAQKGHKEYVTLFPDDRDKETVNNAIEWIKSLVFDDLEEGYLRNLWIVCHAMGVTNRQLGLAASLIAAYQRATNKKIEREQKLKLAETSTYQGQIKDKIEREVLCTNLRFIDGVYGQTTLHMFVDDNGNSYKWFASSETLEQGTRYKIKGTIKDLEEYNGIKSTLLTRCKATALAPVEG